MSRAGRSKESIAKADARRVAFKQQRKRDVVERKGGICSDCKDKFHSCIYDLHHIDPTLKTATSSTMMGWSWDRLKTELDNCVLLCSNCHRLHHFGKPQNKHGKEMTDINLDTVELKKAEFTANVGDKQITAKVTDKTEADKADVKKDVPFNVA